LKNIFIEGILSKRELDQLIPNKYVKLLKKQVKIFENLLIVLFIVMLILNYFQ
jgi:hypothetical protein